MLADPGAKVAIFDLNADAGQRAAAELGSICQRRRIDDASVAAGLEAAEGAQGIAPAVKTVGKENAPHPLATYRKTIEVNLIGTFNIISKFVARLAADPLISLGSEVFRPSASGV
ncbi:hypothetical protein [Sphingobium aromaticivastans]|uniref:hypothetical protein n=1 Tax=Sphingobium aromaticivastans TaxID=1778665 RepID=UPI00301B01E1